SSSAASDVYKRQDDDIEARLIGSLSPSPLDGVLSKASTLEIFHQELFLSLNGVRQATDRLNNQWYINQSRTLSPTEREILRFMSRGYSMTQIAEQLKRNIKTIRAHKFNVMSKLGVSSDAGLLEAADILLCMRHCEASNVLHPY
ncbi:DNA-binding transcriptional activator BglJ, partial [Escherichia coli]